MNFNRGLTRNLPVIKTIATPPAPVTAVQTRSGANGTTTTKTTASVQHQLRPEVTVFSSVKQNDTSNHNSCRSSLFISPPAKLIAPSSYFYCSTSSSINWYSHTMPFKSRTIAKQQKNSRGMYDSRAAAASEVMLPLTSMSAQQISLTSRVNIMDNQVENRKQKTTAEQSATTTTYTSPTSGTSKTTALSLATAISSHTSRARESSWPSIKMPHRRFFLTVMAAAVLCIEFRLCSSTIAEGHQTTPTLSYNSQNSSPQTTADTINISSKTNDSLPNTPVVTRELLPSALPHTQSPQHNLSLSPSMPATSIKAKSINSLETAALIESSASKTSSLTASSAVATMEESSTFLMSSLTDTTMMHSSDPSRYDDDDVNASSELLSFPTSVLSTYDGSDLPPLTEAEQAAKDLLTKGFSIPTYLPPFPVFAVADLPAYLNTVSTTTTESPPNLYMESGDINSHENILYYDNAGDHHHQPHQHRKYQIPRRNSSLLGANNVTVQEGSHAYLPCRIHRLQNKPVSWVRMRDGHIISVDQTTFIADQRFQAIFQDDKEYTWSLQVKYVQPTDEGWYECQASSEPKMSAKVYLKVIVPITELIGDQSRFVKAGSKVALHCIVRGTLEPPQYIIWYRDKIQISADNNMGWYTQLDRNIFGHNGDNENTIGSLIIPFVRKMDSGNYTCQPSNSASVSVDLHVLSGEYSASAIMSAARTTYKLNDSYLLMALLLISLYKT